MNEKPILFNAEMVRAILEGRKTQTRRPIKPRGKIWLTDIIQDHDNGKNPTYQDEYGDSHLTKDLKMNPLNADLLWVRETFAYIGPELNPDPGYAYRATDPDWSEMEGFKWTPSIHMPRDASRINLKVKRVWVERVQDISVSDCVQEGISGPDGVISGSDEEIKTSFKNLWESCGYDWDTNPFVWCCEFEVMK